MRKQNVLRRFPWKAKCFMECSKKLLQLRHILRAEVACHLSPYHILLETYGGEKHKESFINRNVEN